MTVKTIDNSFEPYGTFYDEPLEMSKHDLTSHEITSTSKKLDHLFVLPCESYIECPQGTARILISDAPDGGELKTFPVRHHIKLFPGIHFNIIPLSVPLTWNLITPGKEAQILPLSTPYTYQPVSVPFHVRRIIDCWFTRQEKPYNIVKAASRSYELLYVYEGSMNIRLSTGSYAMQAHDLIIYRADTASISIESSCSYLTVIFDVNHRKTLHILNHIFHCTSEMQQVLWKLLIESFEHSYYTGTLIICYLQEALLLLLQFYETISHKTLLSDSKSSQNDLLSEILTYMNTRIAEPITIEEICHEFFISRSSLQALFKTHLNTSPKNYLLNIKLQKSKELIRENQYTISEIAYMLGFSSIHYFSRLFKKYFNTTPSSYVKKISDNQNIAKNK
ncbi:MAG TPA: helix-turn-helix transcriptional regulator [Candidatus Mediterraneibacter pullistercoris]|nr:helix-turn-helix transcriptional regulator [Candidatus Mediterraneibacter pullistercoris]